MKVMTEVEIPWRAPLDWDHLAGFLGRRAVPGVESFDEKGYIRVRRDGRRRRFVASVPPAMSVIDAGARVARMFDAGADSRAIAARLGRDAMLRPLLEQHRGIRVPEGWDPFEIVIRAIVGQQISVAAARAIVGSIAEKCGERADGNLSFPTAARIVSSTEKELTRRAERWRTYRAYAAMLLWAK
mgnify:CR=1 FL=1